MMMGYGFGMGIFGFIINFAVIIGVVYLVIRFVKSEGNGRGAEKRAEEILAERFARGEITEDEYKQMKKALRN
ncbi:SHOCT domain-containing protein [Gorillibacterium massiliense]|uniref:SHOCT domain-containing protein n=1 Tax=Gorillibacterium massiliense TaxID=1280390 RepID=UPI0004B68387|nr:SHOCT domain-containing protein [Gorillibacterium massiliense]